MLPLFSDTNPKAEEFQISLIRQVSVAKRISQMRSLSQLTMRLSRRAILRVNPELSEQELDLIFIAYHYGDDLANCLRKYLRLEASP